MTRRILLILACLFVAWARVSAHPSTALVVDRDSNVYFAYWGGTWKLDASGRLTRWHANDLHFLAYDSIGRFAGKRIADGLNLTPAGAGPVLFAFPESPATFHTDGDLYEARWSIGRIVVDRVKADGSRRSSPMPSSIRVSREHPDAMKAD